MYRPHSQTIPIFFITLTAAIIINYFGSLFLYDELKMALAVDVLLAFIAAFISYQRSLRKHIDELEQRIQKLEQQLFHQH